jgi:hypothetical protein
MDTLLELTPVILFNGKRFNPQAMADLPLQGSWLQHTIINVMLSEGALLSQFPGGLWDRIPKVGTGPGATPGAFYTQAEDASQSGKLKPVISVLDGGDNPSPGGAAHNGFVGFPQVYGYAFATPSGRALLGALDDRLRFRFRRGVSYPTPYGGSAELLTLERSPIRDGEDFGYPGRSFAIWRIQGTFVRPVV